MWLKISNLRFPDRQIPTDLGDFLTQSRGFGLIPPNEVQILKESRDHRRQRGGFCYTLRVRYDNGIEVERLQRLHRGWHISEEEGEPRVNPLQGQDLGERSEKNFLVVGSGPAGIFAALTLAVRGGRVTVIERGDPVEVRFREVNRFFDTGELNPSSNIAFGEGGAGTFSDGKLTTRKNHPHIPFILAEMVKWGAPPEILTDGKPHIGTDRIRAMAIQSRGHLRNLGVNLHFNHCLTDLTITDGTVREVFVNGTPFGRFDAVILAPGHSARDTLRLLHRHGVPLSPKPFAMGVRVEHPQEWLDQRQYGADRREKNLPPADYRLVHNLSADRSIYSFCMCPGGEIVCSSSLPGFHVVNGMSNYRRNSEFANAGLVVKVNLADFGSTEPLAGLEFQEGWEREAFTAAGGGYWCPAQRIPDFLAGREGSPTLPRSSYRPGIRSAPVARFLPPFVASALREGLAVFERHLPGFCGAEGLILGLESRTSAPWRIERTEAGHSPAVRNLYPCGEGAGWAGGIVSAAIDGIGAATKAMEGLGWSDHDSPV